MSNHRVQTWDHRKSKPFDSKLLSLDYHLNNLILEILINGVHDLVYGDSHSRSLEHDFWKLSKWWKITFEQGNKMWLDDPILNSMSEGTSESNKVNLHTAPGHQKINWKSSFTTSSSSSSVQNNTCLFLYLKKNYFFIFLF